MRLGRECSIVEGEGDRRKLSVNGGVDGQQQWAQGLSALLSVVLGTT